MSVRYRTEVVRLPATPLGLLPSRLAVTVRCEVCFVPVELDHQALIDHAAGHDPDLAGDAEPGLDRPR
jgi:hypothetical protein